MILGLRELIGCKRLSYLPCAVPGELWTRSRLAARYPRREEISRAALHTSAEKNGRRFLLARVIGPDVLIPPTTVPVASNIAAPTHLAPIIASSSSTEKPWSRIWIRSFCRRAMLVIVFGV